MAKVNYQYEKRQKELAKKRKKDEKLRLKQQKKNNQQSGNPIEAQDEAQVESSTEETSTGATPAEKSAEPEEK